MCMCVCIGYSDSIVWCDFSLTFALITFCQRLHHIWSSSINNNNNSVHPGRLYTGSNSCNNIVCVCAAVLSALHRMYAVKLGCSTSLWLMLYIQIACSVPYRKFCCLQLPILSLYSSSILSFHSWPFPSLSLSLSLPMRS